MLTDACLARVGKTSKGKHKGAPIPHICTKNVVQTDAAEMPSQPASSSKVLMEVVVENCSCASTLQWLRNCLLISAQALT
jgi:hypothetical protein